MHLVHGPQRVGSVKTHVYRERDEVEHDHTEKELRPEGKVRDAIPDRPDLETDELLRLVETIKRLGARLIAICGNPASTLAQAADVALNCQVSKEACPLNLVPTASTTAALALGDALAMTLLVAKG